MLNEKEKSEHGVAVPPITDREITSLLEYEIRMTHMVYPSKVNQGKCTQQQYNRRIQILQHLLNQHQPKAREPNGTLSLFP